MCVHVYSTRVYMGTVPELTHVKCSCIHVYMCTCTSLHVYMCICVYMRMAYETSIHHPNLRTISGLHSLLSTEAVSRRAVSVPRRTLSGTKKVVFGTLDGNIGIKECRNVGMLIFLGFSWVLLGFVGYSFFFLVFFGFLGLSGVFLVFRKTKKK